MHECLAAQFPAPPLSLAPTARAHHLRTRFQTQPETEGGVEGRSERSGQPRTAQDMPEQDRIVRRAVSGPLTNSRELQRPRNDNLPERLEMGTSGKAVTSCVV